MENKFTIPKVKSYPKGHKNENNWFVWFRYNGKLVRIKDGINSISDHEKRLEEAILLAEVLNERLKQGWTPLKAKALPQPYKEKVTVLDAYKKALELIKESDLETKTKSEYTSHYKTFTKAVKALKWDFAMFVDLDIYHFTMIIEKMASMKKKSNAYYNKHICICKSFCSFLKRNFVVKENKALGIPGKKTYSKREKIINSRGANINHQPLQ